jgi:hypothetical protein
MVLFMMPLEWFRVSTWRRVGGSLLGNKEIKREVVDGRE